MKYRIGDKVRIKIWEEMKEEFGLTELGSINSDLYYTQQMELRLNSLGLDRAIKISAVNDILTCIVQKLSFLKKELEQTNNQ